MVNCIRKRYNLRTGKYSKAVVNSCRKSSRVSWVSHFPGIIDSIYITRILQSNFFKDTKNDKST